MKKNKLLILGASGFIGKNLAIYFSKKKNFNVTGTYFRKKTYINNVKMLKCDLTKKKEADKLIKNSNIIIQAAATTSGAKDILAKPYIHVNDNAIMNSMVTRSAYDHKVKHIIVFSCSIMYQSSKKPSKEIDFNPSNNMYPNYFGAGWMKLFVEKMCEFYSKLGKNKYTLIRHSNIYGPNDKFDLKKSHVLAASINKVINCKNNKISIWGDGKEKRDLLFISDLINFVDLAIKKQKNNYELYNAGSGKLISVNELIKKIIKIYGNKISATNDLTKKTLKTFVCLNCNKARKELGWYPKVSLENGIKKTIDWYLKNINH
jgi:nucleoside-diphosphate-sugar epimerase|tara:strand:- start:6310 stop:7263 length:954 start_codon:yes stop_codon:yes gene_type:complete